MFRRMALMYMLSSILTIILSTATLNSIPPQEQPSTDQSSPIIPQNVSEEAISKRGARSASKIVADQVRSEDTDDIC